MISFCVGNNLAGINFDDRNIERLLPELSINCISLCLIATYIRHIFVLPLTSCAIQEIGLVIGRHRHQVSTCY